MPRTPLSIAWLACIALCLAASLHAAPQRDRHVQAELVAAADAVPPGGSLPLALRLTHDPGWHTYWTQPGTGLPTTLSWELPPGWTATDPAWPAPEPILDGSGAVSGNGYSGELLVPLAIRAPADAPAGTVRIVAKVSWLMCADTCVPGSATLELRVAVRTGAPALGTAWAPAVAAARSRVPAAPPEDWSYSATRESGGLRLRVRGPHTRAEPPVRLRFFDRDGAVDYAAAQSWSSRDGAWEALLTLDPAAGALSRLAGVLAAEPAGLPSPGPKSLTLELPVAAPGVESGGLSAGILLLGLLGGLVLNLMPCVFPVLGVKILGFVNQAGQSRSRVAAHGLAYAGGVLLSLWILAAGLLALRAGGDQLGWGFQLQSPGFVFALAALLLVFALNLGGLFEVGLSATGAAGSLSGKEGYTGSFLAGVLATVVATPCSAPLLGPALGAALALPPISSLALFTAIGLGLAAPYLLLSVFPGLVRILPRPGAWMETFKQAMAFLLHATVAYLVWNLAGLMSEYRLLLALFGLVLVALAAWVYGRFTGAAAARGRRRAALGLSVLLLAGGLGLGFVEPSSDWKPWSPQAVAEARREGRIVFVDFTARWCATCQTNKLAVFSSGEVNREFARLGVVKLRADWTGRDPQITAELARFGQAAVPFNLVYRPDLDTPLALPSLLTPGVVLEAVRGPTKPEPREP